MGKAIFTDEATEQEFRRNGYVVRPLLNASDIELLRSVHNSYVTEVHSDVSFSGLASKGTRRQIFDAIFPCIAPRLQSLIPGYRVCTTTFITKQPGGQNGQVILHQDPSFADPKLHTTLKFWCPLTDVDEDNGCLQFVAGSHKLRNHISCYPENLAPWADWRELLEREFLTPVPMPAGHALIFDGCILHASEVNKSSQVRIAVSSALLPNEVPIRVYRMRKDTLGQLTVLEFTDDYIPGLDYLTPMDPPYPPGVTDLGTIDYRVTPLSLKQIESLRPRFGSQSASEDVKNALAQTAKNYWQSVSYITAKHTAQRTKSIRTKVKALVHSASQET